MANETHFTEDDRKLLTLLEERQKKTNEALNNINIKLDNKYTTKLEHSELVERVVKIESIIQKLTWIIVVAVIGALLGLVINIQ